MEVIFALHAPATLHLKEEISMLIQYEDDLCIIDVVHSQRKRRIYYPPAIEHGFRGISTPSLVNTPGELFLLRSKEVKPNFKEFNFNCTPIG